MHFSGESHSFHCLLKFVKRLKTAPLLPLPINLIHIHRLNNCSHLDDFQFCMSGPEFSKPSPNCLLPSCLWMPHKHLQLNLCKIKHIICPQQFNVLLLYSLHQLLSHPENPKVILDSSLFPLSTFLTHPLPPYTLPSFRPSPVLSCNIFLIDRSHVLSIKGYLTLYLFQMT